MPEQIKLSPKDWATFIHALENPSKPNPRLKALLRGEEYIPDCPPHKYIKNKTSGIGFCEVCYSDDMNSNIHIKE